MVNETGSTILETPLTGSQGKNFKQIFKLQLCMYLQWSHPKPGQLSNAQRGSPGHGHRYQGRWLSASLGWGKEADKLGTKEWQRAWEKGKVGWGAENILVFICFSPSNSILT